MSNAVNHILHPMHKNYLPSAAYTVYGYSAPAKSGVRIGVLVKYKATHDAPSVFFCVLASSHHFFSDMAIARVANKIMVGWMGAEQSAPVTLYAGYANPVQLTTSEIGVSGGGIKSQYKEAAICWLLPLPIIRNSFGLSPLFAAIVRQSNLFFTMLLLRLSVTLVALWCVITSVSSLDALLCTSATSRPYAEICAVIVYYLSVMLKSGDCVGSKGPFVGSVLVQFLSVNP